MSTNSILCQSLWQVEGFFNRPDPWYTANCGGAVRSGGEVFVFDACNSTQPWRVSAYECGEGLRNMKVTRLNSYQYEVCQMCEIKLLLIHLVNHKFY